MVSVGGRLWCGCQNRVLVLNPDTLQLEVAIGMGVGGVGETDLGEPGLREREMGLGAGIKKYPTVQGEAKSLKCHRGRAPPF